MGRPKTYDRDALTEKAMGLFWLHGFHGTSTQALVEGLGVNRYSLYAEFGSKQGVFEAAMGRYAQDIVTRYFGHLETGEPCLADLYGVIEFFTGQAGAPGSAHGCFLCNVATERAPHDPSSRGFVEAYVGRIAAAIERCLRHAAARGELRDGLDLPAEAHLLAATLLGFWVLLRSQVDPAILQGAGRGAIEHLRRLERGAG